MNRLHICIAADKNYTLPLKCLVNSIFLNSLNSPCTIHVLFTGITKKYRDKMVKKYKNSNLSIDFIDMSKYDFDFFGIDMRYWTKAIFYRIMIPEIFKDLNRILYLDGDTLVLQDLHDLFNTQMNDDSLVAMVIDRFSWKTHTFKLNTQNYYNSGVILFDIKKCREFDFSKKCIQWIHDNPKQAIFPDQDAINIIGDGKIFRINNIYNKQITAENPTKLEIQPFIMHFLSALKPWMYNAPLKYSKIYRQYMPSQFATFLKQFFYSVRYFCYHKKYAMTMKHRMILKQMKYYIFNICVHTKNLNMAPGELLNTLKQNRDNK